jgi:stage IV sporulation protein FB
MVFSGRIMAIGLLLYNIYLVMKGNNSLAYVIAAIFVFAGTVRESRYCSYYYLLHQNNRKNRLKTGNKFYKRIIKVHRDMPIRFVASQFSPGNSCTISVLDDAGNLLYQLNEADIMDGLLKYGYDSTIGQIKK